MRHKKTHKKHKRSQARILTETTSDSEDGSVTKETEEESTETSSPPQDNDSAKVSRHF